MSIDQGQTPYADAVRAYADNRQLRYHLPGHGGGHAGADRLVEFFGGQAVSLDLMPMMQGIDLGSHPTPLEQSLDLAADAWGARRTWFLTNGATQGNHVAVLALAELGDTLLVQRSVHSSVIDGLMISGSRAGFVAPVIDTNLGIAHGVTAEDAAAAITESQGEGAELSALYVVSPNYFGCTADIAALAEVAHDAGIPLVVDEAWGPHFGFHDDLPRNALSEGADLVVSSTHKLGGSLTQTAMLHLGEGPFADRLEPRIERVHRSLQSTSESCLLIASLDLARADLATGHDSIGRSIERANALRDAIRGRGRFRIASDTFPGVPGYAGTDPLRIVVDTASGGISGHRARALLERDDDLLVEMATDAVIVLLYGAGVSPDLDPFLEALHRLPDERDGGQGDAVSARGRIESPLPGATRMTVREAYFAPHEVVAADAAVGRIAADSLAAYPPGIPNVLPGEEITAQTVAFLQAVAASPNGLVRGALDDTVSQIRVLRS